MNSCADIDAKLASINAIYFSTSGVFTNSLLKTMDTTQIIRDIRDEEVVFFQGKKMHDIDYELMNTHGTNNSEEYAQYEMSKLLEGESSVDLQLNETIDRLIPQELRTNVDYRDDIDELVSIYKRCYIIKKLWASNKNIMLDAETNHLLAEANTKMHEVITLLENISEYTSVIQSQKGQLRTSYIEDLG
jgi:hypothetical protein